MKLVLDYWFLIGSFEKQVFVFLFNSFFKFKEYSWREKMSLKKEIVVFFDKIIYNKRKNNADIILG